MLSEYEIELLRATLAERQHQLDADRVAATVAAEGQPSLLNRLLARFSSASVAVAVGGRARLRSRLAP
jgi:hypothetical protein